MYSIVRNEKLKLKEDEAGNKISEVRGIRAGCKVMETRYSNLEGVQVKIPTKLKNLAESVELFERKA